MAQNLLEAYWNADSMTKYQKFNWFTEQKSMGAFSSAKDMLPFPPNNGKYCSTGQSG